MLLFSGYIFYVIHKCCPYIAGIIPADTASLFTQVERLYTDK